MSSEFLNKRIVLGVTGSIACYKSADLASKLSQAGATVDVILSASAEKFISALSFQTVTGRKTYTDADLWGSDGHVLHINITRDCDLLLIAPATANTLAKLASGIANNMLSLSVLSASCPVWVAPAMDAGMFAHPATHSNLDTLTKRGVRVIGPESGRMASGLIGPGRMTEPEDLLVAIQDFFYASSLLEGRKVLITAGPTREAIDPVRFISNRSSGKQGYALARAAVDMGAKVTLISGPSTEKPPEQSKFIQITTALEMQKAVEDNLSQTDILVMAAAVSDYRPKIQAGKKIKKVSQKLELELTRNPDILLGVSKIRISTGWPRVVIGFAAETDNLVKNAAIKLKDKQLDLIAANDITTPGAGFETSTNIVTILDNEGEPSQLPEMSKYKIAQHVLEKAAGLLKS